MNQITSYVARRLATAATLYLPSRVHFGPLQAPFCDNRNVNLFRTGVSDSRRGKQSDNGPKRWWHSFLFPSGECVIGARSPEDLSSHLAQFQIPADLKGKRVLDIGTWDGWFSFEMERRGAEVVAVDCWDNPSFRYAHEQFGSHVQYVVRDIYELTPRDLGYFDIVLFFGVLYHLKHPLLALEKVCALAADVVYIESYVLDETLAGAVNTKRSLMEFYETDGLQGQSDNWIAPNARCLLDLCRTAGFARVSLKNVIKHRAYVTCYRRWRPTDASSSQPVPILTKVAHNANYGINFCSHRDEYVSCWFRTLEPGLARNNVLPSVGPFGAVPLTIELKERDLWQANFKLPPGLGPGFHDVQVRLKASVPSNPLQIAIDIDPEPTDLSIIGVADGRTWEPDTIRLAPDGVLSVWVKGLPSNADINNTDVFIDSTRLIVADVLTSSESTQVNALIPEAFPAGPKQLQIRMRNTNSNFARLIIVAAGRS